jgi:short-subunit dehydrogenase involved in D-alanine esterification of teichoic acids
MYPMNDFDDKTAVITGGASGIGRALGESANVRLEDVRLGRNPTFAPPINL